MEALACKTHGGVVKVNSNGELQNETSEYREHSQKSRGSEVGIAVEQTGEVTPLTVNTGTHLRYSEDSKSSQNSWI